MSQPDPITARDESKPFTNCPDGVHQAVCVDVVDLGERVEAFQSKPPKVVRKLAIVYQVDEINPDTGKRFEVHVEKTLSMFETAGLRKWLEAWRGRAYTDEQAKAGVPLDKMVGINGLLTVAHKQSSQGRTYANAANIMPLPKTMSQIALNGYVRAEFWTKRKEQYAKEVADFRRAAEQHGPDEELPSPSDDSDLPF